MSIVSTVTPGFGWSSDSGSFVGSAGSVGRRTGRAVEDSAVEGERREIMRVSPPRVSVAVWFEFESVTG